MTSSHVRDRFGESAGKLWSVLNEKGPQPVTKLKKNSGLNHSELLRAVGWLARENKIRKHESKFLLGETNLTDHIGSNAGKVWKALDIWDEAHLSSLMHLTRLSEEDIHAALGWLARENKIDQRPATQNPQKTYFVIKR